MIADAVRIVREIAAPRELVFDAWTKPEALVRWFAPRGCELEIRHMDVRSGGTFHTCVHHPTFGDCWCTGTYLTVDRASRLTYSIRVSDAAGRAVSSEASGHDADWPEETTVDVTFEEREGRTLVTLCQSVSEAVARRTGAYPSWLEMLDRLDTLIRDKS